MTHEEILAGFHRKLDVAGRPIRVATTVYNWIPKKTFDPLRGHTWNLFISSTGLGVSVVKADIQEFIDALARIGFRYRSNSDGFHTFDHRLLGERCLIVVVRDSNELV